MQELLWLLLPVAAFSGWAAAQRQSKKEDCGDYENMSSQYYEGINYLLNEQPDKAANVFVRLLEVNSDTVELHLALGNLFRRRGEVDRAIMLHQNLTQRSSLTQLQNEQAVLELAQDYLAAGLLDRAEQLFIDLSASTTLGERALRLLIDVYQQEKEWSKALEAAKDLEKRSGVTQNKLVAHFYCELAERSIEMDIHDKAEALVRKALAVDPIGVRANLIRGRHNMKLGNFADAINAYQQVLIQDSRFISEIIKPMLACYETLGKGKDISQMLAEVAHSDHGPRGVSLIARSLAEQGEKDAARKLIDHFLSTNPSNEALLCYIELHHSEKEINKGSLSRIWQVLKLQTELGPRYHCDSCGFGGQILHWLCPSCKTWGSISPV